MARSKKDKDVVNNKNIQPRTSYIRTEWREDVAITAERLNNMEKGIHNALDSTVGGEVLGPIIMKDNILFDNNKSVYVKDNQGNDHISLYMNPQNEFNVGTGVYKTVLSGNGISINSLSTEFRGTALFNNNTPIRGKMPNGDEAELIYTTTQGEVRAGSYNTHYPLVLNSSEDVKFENTVLRRTYTLWHNGNLKVESGNWTPILQSTGGLPVPSQVVQNGKYHRVGNTVFVTGNIKSTNTVGFFGQLVISGLPFLSSANSYSSVTFGWMTGIITNNNPFLGYTQPGTDYITLGYNDTTTGLFHTANQANFAPNNQCDIAFSLTYLVD